MSKCTFVSICNLSNAYHSGLVRIAPCDGIYLEANISAEGCARLQLLSFEYALADDYAASLHYCPGCWSLCNHLRDCLGLHQDQIAAAS